ncbi:pilus assembly protein [Paraburkholderia sp. SARCC-3016]|uniref:TadE/TadG family type IV pilus assembly protein n=1 Tax=Paraburkholderia sp. SARCC-3016 TaxID=3058611 RepID=UPI00280A1DAA|nr:pilus assembly protein [Paraburkholderia sp. SARCC-3016]MDQ7981734.1 pilus assembly protein [Paraburkholderia sp. SARCC-3016]
MLILCHHRLTQRRASRGSAAIEFAILLPFLIMILVGIIDVNLIFYDSAILTNAVRAGARAGTVVQVPPLTTSQIVSVTTAYAQNNLVGGGSATSPTVTVTQSNGTTPGGTLQVAASYTYQGLLLGSVFSALTGPVVLNATAIMIYE